MTTPFENFVNTALGKSLSADVTLPTADDIPVFTGIGRQVTGKTIAELGLALSADVGVFSDSTFRIQDNANATNQLAFEASGIGTGQTRTIIMPDVDVNLASYARAYQSTGLKTITKQLYTVFPTGSTDERYLTTDGSMPNFIPPESPFLFILLPDDPDSSRPVLVNVKGIGYSTSYPASGTWVFERRIVVGRGTEGVDTYGGLPLVQTVSDFSYGPFAGAIFEAFCAKNATIQGSQRVLCFIVQNPNNTVGSNLVVRVIAEIIYSEDTLPDTWL